MVITKVFASLGTQVVMIPRRSLVVVATLAGAAVFCISLEAITGANIWHVDQATFFATLLLSIVVFEWDRPRAWITPLADRFADFLTRRGAFRSAPETEAPKFALIRLLFGALMAERGFWMVAYLQPSDWVDQPLVLTFAIANLAFAALVAIGLFTQFSFAYLILVQWQLGDAILGTSTLGNDIATMLAFLLIFANAGAHFSVDQWIIRKGGPVGRFLSVFYYRRGLPSINTLQIAKFLTLFAYGCVCIYSMAMHLGESAWMNGSAGPLLLTNSFASRYALELSYFFELGGWCVLLGCIALWGMFPWYVTIIPFVLLGGWFRTYVIAWGILFFSLSLFVLQLGWLAHFEFLMFAALFWQRRFMEGPNSLQVAYDDRCNLCDRTVRFVKAVDLFARVELRPLSKNVEWLQRHGIDSNDARTDLYGVEANTDKAPVKGFDFYLLLSKHVLLLLPAYPFLLVGKYLGGPAVYRFIADRRIRYFGVCQIPTSKPDHSILPPGERTAVQVGQHDPVVPIGVHMAVLALAYLVTMPVPVSMGWSGPLVSGLERIQSVLVAPGKAAHVYGITPINVFNQADLRSAENWFTISVVGPDGETVLPILSKTGGRLSAHRSDRVYFGHTVPFRRAMIGKKGCGFATYRKSFEYLAGLFDTRSGTRVYEQFHQPLPNLKDLLEGRYAPEPITAVCRVQF